MISFSETYTNIIGGKTTKEIRVLGILVYRYSNTKVS